MKRFYVYLSVSFFLFVFSKSIAQPIITSFSPGSGPVNTVVTILGNNFNTTPANNIIYFGAAKGTVLTATINVLTVQVPAGATFKPFTVTADNRTAYSSKPFILTYTGCGNQSANFAAHQEKNIPASTKYISVADLDNDDKVDIIAGPTPAGFAFKQNTSIIGNIQFSSGSYTTGIASPYFGIGDFNRDGKYDIAIPNGSSGSISVIKNTSSGTNISFAPKIDYTNPNRPTAITTGDIDGDGRPDLAVTCQIPNVVSTLPCRVSIYRNQGIGTNISFSLALDLTTGIDPRSPVIQDIDGDNKPDLVLVNYNSFSVSVFINTSTPGNITFAAPVDFSTGAYYPTAVALGDFDNDGKTDMAVSAYNSSITYGMLLIYKNTSVPGNAGFAAYLPNHTAGGPWAVAVGDLNGDGKVDIVLPGFGDFGVNKVTMHFNVSTPGTIAFPQGTDFEVDDFPFSVIIADLDNDGKPDVASGSNSQPTISILRNISPAAPVVTATATTPSCSSNSGSITATGSAGAGPYQYSINGTSFQSSGMFTGLSAGQYTVTVNDVNGCRDTCHIIIVANANTPQVTATTVSSTCSNNNGSIMAIGSGGSGTLQFSIDNINYQLSGNFAGLSAGTYSVSVRDNNCINTIPVTIIDIGGPQISLNVVSPDCTNNGIITSNCTSGTPPYLFSIDGTNFQSSGSFAGLAAGNYTITAKDANGCSINSVAILQTNNPVATGSSVMGACETNTGVINAAASGGTAPYNFSIDAGPYQAAITFNGLVAGNHTLHVKDVKGCLGSTIVNVSSTCFAEIYVPTAFTPGGDIHNDILRALPINIKSFSYFVVYNRWGQKIFFTKDPNQGWDGSFRGMPQGTGSFIWIAEGIDFKGNKIKRKGSVILIR